MSDELDTPLRAFESKIRDQFDLSKLPGWSLHLLQNFLDGDEREDLDSRMDGFFTCNLDDAPGSKDHFGVLEEVRIAYGEQIFLAGIPEHRMHSAETRKLVMEKFKAKIIKDIRCQIRYIDGILEEPILYDISSLGQELIGLIESEDSDYHSIDWMFIAWSSFCEDYLRLCSYWEITGALVYGHAQYDQLLFFLYKTQGVWVGENVSLLETRNYIEFDDELWRIRCSKSILWRIKETFRVRR